MMVWKMAEPRDERMAAEMVGWSETCLVVLREPLMDA